MGLMDFISPALTVASEAAGAHEEGKAQQSKLLQALGLQQQKQHAQDIEDKLHLAQTDKAVADAAKARQPIAPRNKQIIGATDGFYEIGDNGQPTPVMSGGKVLRPHDPKVAQEPKGQVVQGPNGPVLVNPRDGTSIPVTDPSGQQLRAKPPANITQAVNSNRQQLLKIDRAIANLQQHPTAVGLRRSLPDALNQVIDPDGVDTRAGVSDIGSLLIHDRTGAAMSAAESQRLMPFIPGPRDQSAAAIKKLQRLKQQVQMDTDAMAASFGVGDNAPAAPTDGKKQVQVNGKTFVLP